MPALEATCTLTTTMHHLSVQAMLLATAKVKIYISRLSSCEYHWLTETCLTEPRERQVSLASLPLPKVSKDEEQDAARRRAISEAGPRPNMTSLSKDDANGNAAAANGDTAVQQTKEKTECACGKNGEHFPKVVLDQTFDCTIENLYNLLYFSDFTKKFLVEQKNTGKSPSELLSKRNVAECIE